MHCEIPATITQKNTVAKNGQIKAEQKSIYVFKHFTQLRLLMIQEKARELDVSIRGFLEF